MSPFVGSSRSTRETTMVSSLSLNQPFGRNHFLVWVGEGGIMKKVASPIVNVSTPLEFA
jgi:hypothetical protein